MKDNYAMLSIDELELAIKVLEALNDMESNELDESKIFYMHNEINERQMCFQHLNNEWVMRGEKIEFDT